MNQPAVNGGFAPQTLFLGLAASSLASSFLRVEELSARSFLLWGLPAALGLCLLSALLAAEFQARELFSGKGVFSRLGCGVSGLWFAVELIRTVRTAQEVCWSQFSSMAALSVLPLLLWAGWALPEAVLDRSSRVLWWLAGLGALLCAAGLAGQLHWQNLFPASYRFTGQILGRYSTRNISHGPFFARSGSGARRSGCRWAALGCRQRSALEWRFYLAHGRGAACPAMSCCVPGHWGPFPGSTRFFCFSGWPQCSSASVCWPTSSGCSGRSSAAEVSVR